MKIEEAEIYRKGKKVPVIRFSRESKEMQPLFLQRVFKWIKEKGLKTNMMLHGKNSIIINK